jgi:hypothetical protein
MYGSMHARAPVPPAMRRPADGWFRGQAASTHQVARPSTTRLINAAAPDCAHVLARPRATLVGVGQRAAQH